MLSTTAIERFGGIARLYGVPALEKFIQSHVAVIGIGGVGSWTAEALARSGIGAITMVDLDELCITNINRQLHAMDGQIGKQKTDAMAERIKAINPECKVVCEQAFYSERNSEELLSRGFDYVVDAIDHVKAKSLLVASCKKLKIPMVVCGGAGGLRNPTKIEVADMARVYNDALIKQVRNELRSNYGFPKGGAKKVRKFGVECVFSSESPVFPQCDGSVSGDRPQDQDMRLNCTTGYGSITHMTATVGFVAAERCLEKLATSV